MIVLGLILGLIAGFYLKEIVSVLKKIEVRLGEMAVPITKQKDITPPIQSQTSFAEPASRAEMAAMMERERIEMLNRPNE